MRRLALLSLALPCLAAPWAAQAQIQVQPDGVMRAIAGVSTTIVTGNTKSSSIALNGEAIQLTDHSKWTLLGRGLYAENDTGVSAASLAGSTQYDRDIDRDHFAFGKLDFLRDKPANLLSRLSAYTGLGRHLVRNDKHTWDAIIGLGYTQDRYVLPTVVSGEERTRYGRNEMLLSQSSNHKLTSTTVLRQKVEVYPDLRHGGEYRWVFDGGLSVAMTSTMSLSTGLIYRHNSNPGVGVKRGDATLLTGIVVRIN
jgi:putative salt-induced outer membrane protein YdiY